MYCFNFSLCFSEVLEGNRSCPSQHSIPHTVGVKKLWNNENLWAAKTLVCVHCACYLLCIVTYLVAHNDLCLNCLPKFSWLEEFKAKRTGFCCCLESKTISGCFNYKLADSYHAKWGKVYGSLLPTKGRAVAWKKPCFYFPLHRRMWLSRWEVEHVLLLVTL